MAGNGSVLYKPKRGETLRLSDRTSIQILAPDSAFASSTANVNNASIVFKLTHVDVGVIFTGDLEYEGDVAGINGAISESRCVEGCTPWFHYQQYGIRTKTN